MLLADAPATAAADVVATNKSLSYFTDNATDCPGGRYNKADKTFVATACSDYDHTGVKADTVYDGTRIVAK